MPHSHHSHSGQFCKHASGTLEDVVKEAIQQRFQVYGLTEHVPRYREVDLYPEEKHMDLDSLSKQFSDFLDEAHRLQSVYASEISILVGLETEFITELDLDNLQSLLGAVGDRVEYLVGSVHHVNGIPIDFDYPTYQRALASFGNGNWNENGESRIEDDQEEGFLSAYFDAQFELLQRFKPEIVGHFDLCRLYTPSLRLRDYPRVFEKAERNVRFAVEYGALFELNAAAFRKQWDTAYPAEDVVAIILKHGGRFALSDDSHGPHAVGMNYHRLPKYLQSVGISELWYLEKTTDMQPNSAGRFCRPVKLEGEWMDHAFWRQIRST